MKLLSNRIGSFLTGNEIADAVMYYGLALMRRRDVALVNIPFIDADGVSRRVDFTVGWLTGTVAIQRAESTDELIDTETVARIYERADRVGEVVHGVPFHRADIAGDGWPEDEQGTTHSRQS